jgi:hypothetical protein
LVTTIAEVAAVVTDMYGTVPLLIPNYNIPA